GLAARRQHLDSGVVREPCARRDQPPDDDVLLETAQLVRLARDGRLGEHARGLLERRGRDEAVGRQRGLRDAEQHGLRRGGALALRDDPLVLLLEPELVHELAHDELRVADLFDPDASEHLADDDLDVLVVDRDALEAVDLLHLVHEVALQLAVAEHRQVVVRVGRPVHERLACPHTVALVDADVLAPRDQVLTRLAVVGADHDLALALRILDDDLAGEARDLVELLPHGHALEDLLVLDPARELGEDRIRERVPLDENRARLDPLVGLDLDLGTVDHRVALPLPAALVGHADLTVAVGRDQVAVTVHDRTQVVVLDQARALRLVLGRLDDAARRPADGEGPHRELRARFADGLGRDNTHRLAELREPPGAEVTPVAHDANPALGIARERGADAHTLKTRILDLLGELLAEVRGDRCLDDLARGLRHEAAHAGELADLLLATPCAGISHHVDRVELATLLARLELAEHLLRDQLGDVRPDVDDLVVALA